MQIEYIASLFAEANPVPDVENTRRELGASAVDLATLESRSRTMDTKHLNQLEPAAPPKRRWRPVVVFATALILVLVVIGGSVMLLQGDTPPAADEPTPTVAPVTTAAPQVTTTVPHVTTTAVPQTTAAVPTPPPLGEGWEVFVVDGDKQPTMGAGFVDGIGWIVVGGPHIMTSSNGTDWIESDTEGVVLDNAGFLTGVIAGGPGALAYGRTCEGGGDFGHEPFPCPQEPVMYGSSDGLTWERITSDAFHGCASNEAMECYAGIDDLAVSSDGSLMATGPDTTSRSGAEGDPYITESAVWTSEDGMLWQRHDVPLAPFVPDGWFSGAESLGDLVHTGDRWLTFLPVYYWPADSDFEEGTTIVLESQDGGEWAIVDTGETFAEGGPDRVVGGSNGLLAVGGQTAWWSPDGHEWTQSTITGDYWYDRVIALESGFLAYTREGPAAFAFSPDGITWVTVEAGDDLTDVGWNELAGAELDGEVTLVGVGYGGDPEIDQESYGAAITTWIGTLTD